MAKQAESETDPQTAGAVFAGLTIEGMLHDRYDGSDARDIFAKVEGFKLTEQARAVRLYPFFQPLDRNDGPEAEIYGRRVVMLGSNNYLGLTRHPRVLQAARDAIRAAAPFPNPPRTLVDESTGVIVFTFGFTVEMGERPIFRLRRYGE